jgi:FkbH-like protein
MNFPSLAAIEKELAVEPPHLTPFHLAVLRNITIEGMQPYLRYAARRDGLDLRIAWGDFDNVLQEAAGGGSGAITPKTNAVLVDLWLPAFSAVLGLESSSHSDGTLEQESRRVLEYCAAVMTALRTRTNAPVFWVTFEPPSMSGRPGLDAAIARLNDSVAALMSAAGNAWAVESAACVEQVGAANFYDWRYWRMARAPLSRPAMAALSADVARHVRRIAGRARKCLVLDCDNVLWGGIVGEDGIDGIQIGTEPGGKSFVEFQKTALALHERGVLLAICSKNNEEDVLEVFRSRPEMILQERHFSVMRINWHDKPQNLREIAAALNIGVDSLVLADDSEFEIEMVRAALPHVETLFLPATEHERNHRRLASCGWFDAPVVTDEDRRRGAMYLAENTRAALRAGVADLTDYLSSLEMKAVVGTVGDYDLDRVTQLCQKTNQFNLTTRRYSRDELAARTRDGHVLLQLRLTDRFGDYGLVGFSMMAIAGDEATIDTFLMSCRALGRGVESVLLDGCVRAARAAGARTIVGCYVPSAKNSQVADFYERHGFVSEGSAGEERRFVGDLSAALTSIPSHLHAEQNVLYAS